METNHPRFLPPDDDEAGDLKAVTLVLHLPPPLAETLRIMAQYHQCSVEAMVIRLIGNNHLLQRYYTRESLNAWMQGLGNG